MSRSSNFAKTAWRLLTLRRIAVADIPDSPGLLSFLWVVVSALFVTDYVVIPADGRYQASAILLSVSVTLLTALIGSWIALRRSDATRFGIVFMLSSLGAGALWLILLLLPYVNDALAWTVWIAATVVVLWWSAVLLKFVAGAHEGRWGWGRALLLGLIFLTLISAAQYVPVLDGYLAARAYEAERAGPAQESVAKIDPERLWPAQPALVEASITRITKDRSSKMRTLVLSVAAGGSQQLFGREAAAVESLMRRRLGPDAGTALLSNASRDLNKVPLANGTNLSAMLRGLSNSFDARRGLVIVYLTSHGGPDAELQTDLPNYTQLNPISAGSLARTLDEAGMRRRIVIVSACYSGTWIKPLASPDTIVITASAADRTSFGCDDTREYTVFGEAIIKGGLSRGASFEEAFAELRREVARQEAEEGVTPSLPQAFVGDRMQDVWRAKAIASQVR